MCLRNIRVKHSAVEPPQLHEYCHLMVTTIAVKNPVEKLTDTPTMPSIFQCFKGIQLLKINSTQQIIILTNERSYILEFLPNSD